LLSYLKPKIQTYAQHLRLRKYHVIFSFHTDLPPVRFDPDAVGLAPRLYRPRTLRWPEPVRQGTGSRRSGFAKESLSWKPTARGVPSGSSASSRFYGCFARSFGTAGIAVSSSTSDAPFRLPTRSACETAARSPPESPCRRPRAPGAAAPDPQTPLPESGGVARSTGMHRKPCALRGVTGRRALAGIAAARRLRRRGGDSPRGR